MFYSNYTPKCSRSCNFENITLADCKNQVLRMWKILKNRKKCEKYRHFGNIHSIITGGPIYTYINTNLTSVITYLVVQFHYQVHLS